MPRTSHRAPGSPRSDRRSRPRSAARAVCAALAAGLVALGACRPPAPVEPEGGSARPPNIVLIVVDTLRADRLTEYGHHRDTSGAMGRFLRQATRFERAYAPASWTRPSVASIMSGLMPARHRAKVGGTNRLHPNIVTLAEVLKQRGYSTAAASDNIVVSRETGFDQGFDDFYQPLGKIPDYPDLSVMVQGARGWLSQAPQPFFLYLQPMNVHGPYKVPTADRERFLGHSPSAEFRYYGPLMSGIVQGRLQLRRQVGSSYLESLVDQYDSAVRHSMDQLVQILQALEQRGVAEDTLVVVTSDHGEELFDHGGFSHGYSLFEEVLRVPLYVKVPGQEQGRTVPAPVSLVDLYPSILEMAGSPPRHPVDGVSFAPRLSDPQLGDAPPEPAADRALVFEINNEARCKARAILLGRHKLILVERNYEGLEDRAALFDLAADPTERHNLVVEQPELARSLAARLEGDLKALEAQALPLPQEPEAQIDRERLKALGYL